MKLTTQQKKCKFKKDLEQLNDIFNVIKVYENTYHIVIELDDLIIDYYSSTETWLSRCSSRKIRGNGKSNLISLLKKSSNDDASDFMERELNKAKEANDKLIERFINLQQKAEPNGALERIVFWFVDKRGYKVIK